MYQIPKTRVDIEVVLVSGLEMKGAMFISENLISYTGKPRLEDFLNQEDRFLPLVGDPTRLINKDRIVFLRSSEDDSKLLVESLQLKPRTIKVLLSEGQEMEGVIYSNLPPESLRVSDYFNQKERFLPMYQGSNKLIVNTDHILFVQD